MNKNISVKIGKILKSEMKDFIKNGGLVIDPETSHEEIVILNSNLIKKLNTIIKIKI